MYFAKFEKSGFIKLLQLQMTNLLKIFLMFFFVDFGNIFFLLFERAFPFTNPLG